MGLIKRLLMALRLLMSLLYLKGVARWQELYTTFTLREKKGKIKKRLSLLPKPCSVSSSDANKNTACAEPPREKARNVLTEAMHKDQKHS